MRAAAMIAGLMMCAAAAAGAQTPSVPPTPMILASGTGEVQVTPDRATVLLAVETRARTAAAAGEDNARLQRQVIEAVRKLGVAAKNVSTFGYSVYPEQVNDGKATRVTGYVARNTVKVELERIDLVGPVIDGALESGANVVSSLRFYSSRYDEVRRDALAAAVAEAKADAEAMAKAAGGTLGALSEMSSSSPGPRPMFESQQYLMRASGAADRTPIEAGEQTVQVSVNTRWVFVPFR